MTYTSAVFSCAYDIVEAVAVLLFSGPTNDDGDYERYMAAFQKLDLKVVNRESPIGFLVLDTGNALPNAVWRKRFAEAGMALKSNPTLIVVSSSSLARGVVRAIQWVRPLPLQSLTASNFQEAMTIAEQRRGRVIRGMLALEAEAREAAAARGRAMARANSA